MPKQPTRAELQDECNRLRARLRDADGRFCEAEYELRKTKVSAEQCEHLTQQVLALQSSLRKATNALAAFNEPGALDGAPPRIALAIGRAQQVIASEAGHSPSMTREELRASSPFGDFGV